MSPHLKSLKKQQLSVCLIVKNEAEMLTECLQSVADVADQLIILDTGSTDKTIEIAQSFHAEIHHFEWCDDFSAARNESIKYATGDWILWIDADERLTQASKPKLAKLLKFENKSVIYRVRIKNIKEDGVSFTLSDAHRLFTNHRGLYFDGRIHEQISPSAKKMGATERDCQIELDHLGYSFTGEQKIKKQTRNRKILEEEVVQHPHSAHAHLTLAHNYKVDGNLIDAKRHYEKAIALKQFNAAMEASLLNAYADTLLDLDKYADALPIIQKSLSLKSLQNAAYFLKYRVALKQNQLSEAIMNLQKIQSQREEIARSGSGISTDIEVNESVIWQTIADLYIKQENWDAAAEIYESSMESGELSVKMLTSYFKVLEKLQNWPRALDLLTELIKREGELPVYLSAISTILIRMGEYEAALQTLLHLNKMQPNDPKNRRNIASLYAKLGQKDQAKEWL